MTDKKVIVVYKSITGFTREYAEMICRELDCAMIDLKSVTDEKLSDFDTIIFGGRLLAGTVDGLKNAKELFQRSKASRFIVYATGAAPNDARDMIEEMWGSNLTPGELGEIPHFYMQGGLRYEKMPFGDKMLMKAFSSMMKRKKDKSEFEKQIAASCSYDISAREYIMPLVSVLKPDPAANPVASVPPGRKSRSADPCRE